MDVIETAQWHAKATREMWGMAGLLTNLKIESLLGFSGTLEMAT